VHGISALVVIVGSPIAFTFIDRSLARSEPQLLVPNRLRWATLLAWGGLGLFLAFSYCHQSHWPNEDAVASVGKPRQQVFDRDLWHLVCGSCVEGHVEATAHHSKQFLKRSPPRIFEKGVAKRTA
jgi:hypothetical protein